MGQALSVFLVPEGELGRLPGSQDRRLLAAILRQNREAICEFDKQFTDPDEDEEKPLSLQDAVAEIFAGRFTRPEEYPVYAVALEIVCGHLGEQLDNRGFCPCSTQLYEVLDKELSGRGIPLRLTDLIQRCPIPLPSWNDGYLIGHWSAEEMGRAEPLLAVALAANQPSRPKAQDGKNEPLHPALAVTHGWLQKAVRQPGSMLVGFHG